jgi:hypothetical protein
MADFYHGPVDLTCAHLPTTPDVDPPQFACANDSLATPAPAATAITWRYNANVSGPTFDTPFV